MSRPRLLDLFACAGIAGDGYAAAGFDVTAVDVDRRALRHNPHNPINADAMEVLADTAFLSTFDVIHASPPCQAYSITKHTHDRTHPDLLAPVLDALRAQPVPWIVENVPGAPMPRVQGAHRRRVPPAYTRFLGEQLLGAIRERTPA